MVPCKHPSFRKRRVVVRALVYAVQSRDPHGWLDLSGNTNGLLCLMTGNLLKQVLFGSCPAPQRGIGPAYPTLAHDQNDPGLPLTQLLHDEGYSDGNAIN